MIGVRLALAAVEAAATGEKPAEGAHHGGPGEILMHHVVDERFGHLVIGGIDFGPTKHLIFFVAAALVLLVLIRLALRSYAKDRVPTGLAAFVEMMVVFIRDEVAEKNIGPEGRQYTPLLCSFFFFILTAAFLGLVPFPRYDLASGQLSVISGTATGNISVTLGLAFISFLAMNYAGIRNQGVVHHFTGMIPHGLPWFLIPIMIPVELLGMFSRPFALTIRLFANMLAGHMVITALLMLVPLTAAISPYFGMTMIPVSLGLALFVMILEILVAFIQAFIFTLLTAIFIGMFAHPSH
jgi:F-type H+-transporting ATPase subunit a